MPQIELKQIFKTFNKTKAVNGVNLTIPEGIVFGLLGPNGAGKTTLIRIITNIIAADEGQIFFDSKEVANLDPLNFGYMPEERGLYKKMKVGEQLMYLTQLKGMSYRQAKLNILEWMNKFEIKTWWNKKVSDLSKGMQQKVQFISTVAHKPPLIILDEPFSGLDPINTSLIKNEIFELAKSGATILFSTHRMEQVEEVCEEIALINKGEVLLSGTVKDLKNQFKRNEYAITIADEINIEHNEVFEVINQHANQLKVHLLNGHQTKDILRYFLEHQVDITAFNEILPSINEIFITQVSGQSNE